MDNHYPKDPLLRYFENASWVLFKITTKNPVEIGYMIL